MRLLLSVLTLAFLATAADAGPNPPWAYPAGPPAPKRDPEKIITVPGSDKKINEVEVSNPYGPADWFPNEHPPMPKVVSNGNRPEPRACALCHLATGDGHPESAGVVGLPASYIVRQLKEFQTGARSGARANVMIQISRGMSEQDMHDAANYFSQIRPLKGYVTVIEAATVPKTFVGEGAMRFVTTGANAGTEPIGERIITVPQDVHGAEARNPKTGFNHYVPPGSIKKGEELAKSGGNGKTIPCSVCHGPTFHGLGEVPPIAGRDLLYIVRQLNDMQNGARTGNSMALMRKVVEKLDMNDMISLAAYLGSLDP